MSLSQCRSLSPGPLFLSPCSFSTCQPLWLCHPGSCSCSWPVTMPRLFYGEQLGSRLSLLKISCPVYPFCHPPSATRQTNRLGRGIHHTRNAAWWKLISESDSGQCNARVFIYYVSRSAVLVSISMSIFISISICVFIDLKVCETELYCH